MCLYFCFRVMEVGHVHLRSTFSYMWVTNNPILYELEADSLKVKATICSEACAHYLYPVQNKLQLPLRDLTFH